MLPEGTRSQAALSDFFHFDRHITQFTSSLKHSVFNSFLKLFYIVLLDEARGQLLGRFLLCRQRQLFLSRQSLWWLSGKSWWQFEYEWFWALKAVWKQHCIVLSNPSENNQKTTHQSHSAKNRRKSVLLLHILHILSLLGFMSLLGFILSTGANIPQKLSILFKSSHLHFWNEVLQVKMLHCISDAWSEGQQNQKTWWKGGNYFGSFRHVQTAQI